MFLGSIGRPAREVRGGLLHLPLPLWLGSRGLKVLGLLASLNGHGGVNDRRGLVREHVRIDIVRVGGGRGGRDVHGASEDVGDRGESVMLFRGGKGAAESAEGGEGLMEMVMVILPRGGQSDSKPDWHETGHEGTRFFDVGQGVYDEQHGVDILHDDVDVVDEVRDWGVVRHKPEFTSRAVELPMRRDHFEEVANSGEGAFACRSRFTGR